MERYGNFGLGDHAGQAVGAQDQNIAHEEGMFFNIHFDFWLGSQGADKNALHLALFGFRRGDNSEANLFGIERGGGGQLLQRAAAQKIGAAVADVRDAELGAVDPRCGERAPNAALLEMPFCSLENPFVGEVHGAGEAFGLIAQTCLHLAKKWRGVILTAVQTMLRDRLYRQCAGDFSVGLAAHAVGQNEELQRRNDAKTVFVVCANATYVAYAATCDLHEHSSSRGSRPRSHSSRVSCVHANRALPVAKDFEPY